MAHGIYISCHAVVTHRDDFVSIDIDRVIHPERGLPSGRVNRELLKRGMWILVTILLAVNLLRGDGLVALTGVLYYIFYFRAKYKLTLLSRPMYSNLIFLGIAPYVCYSVSGTVSLAHLVLGVFMWVAVLGHEFAHNVEEKPEKWETRIVWELRMRHSYSSFLGADRCALVAAALFTMACSLGVLFWFLAGKPLIFLFLLAGAEIHIVLLLARLLEKPVKRNAKPFYVAGFTFFLLPCLGLYIDRLYPVIKDLFGYLFSQAFYNLVIV